MTRRFTLAEIDAAGAFLRSGGVLAYPTEAVFGLGCDPRDRSAVETIFRLKKRAPTQGVLLIAADFSQVERFIARDAVPSAVMEQVRSSWPGPATWIFPRSADVPPWIAGTHEGIALRVTAHPAAAALCTAFGGALVSTSANPHGVSPARSAAELEDHFGDALPGFLDAPVGGQTRPTVIREALSGAIIRS